jgi:transcriptional regulator with XRE-family HTH domain
MPKRISSGQARQSHFIREWRKHRGLTQEQLAERIGTTKASISRIETGEQPYTQDFLEACADALMTEPGSLVMRNPLDPDGPWSVWDDLRPVQRKQALRLLRALKDEAEEAA